MKCWEMQKREPRKLRMDYIVPSLGCLEKSTQSQLGSIRKNLNQGVNLDLLNIEDLNLDHQIPRGHPEIVFLFKANFRTICSLPGPLIHQPFLTCSSLYIIWSSYPLSFKPTIHTRLSHTLLHAYPCQPSSILPTTFSLTTYPLLHLSIHHTHVLTSPPFLSLWHHHIPVFFFRCSLPYPSSPSSCPPDPPRSSALYPPFRHIRRLVSEIKIMFLLVFVEYLEEWSKICISTGSSMRLFKFAVITSQRKKSRRWRLRSMRRCWK